MSSRYVVGYPGAWSTLFWGGATDDGARTMFRVMRNSEVEELLKELEIPKEGLRVYKLVPVRNVWPKEEQ